MSNIISPVLMPVFDPNDEVAVITRIYQPSGAKVEKGDALFQVESAKGVWELSAETPGWLEYSLKEGDRLATGSEIAVIHSDAGSTRNTQKEKTETNSRITRKAARLLRELRISEHEFSHLESVREEDVRLHVNQKIRKVRRLGQTMVKEAEVRKLERSGNNQFLSSVTATFSLAEIESLIKKHTKDSFVSGPADYISYRTSLILKRFPALNGYYDSGKAYTYEEVNLGYAMNLNGQGLKVVTLRTPTESYRNFCQKLQELTYAYLQNSLTPQELTGATFSISNMFNFDVDHFLPLLSEGQSGILGIASPDKFGNFKVILSFDHRMIDAVEAAGFLKLLRSGGE